MPFKPKRPQSLVQDIIPCKSRKAVQAPYFKAAKPILINFLSPSLFPVPRTRDNQSKKPFFSNLFQLLPFNFLPFAVILLLTLSALLYHSFPATAGPGINKQINYQAKLTDNSNQAIEDNTWNLEFKLYTQSEGGSPIWTETRTGTNKATTTSGLLSVLLGEVTPLDGIDFTQTLYLGINIGGTTTIPNWDGEMTPRKKLGSVPSAFTADTLDGLDSSIFLKTNEAGTISTTTSQTLLTLNQTGTGPAFEAKVNNITALIVTNNGNVGIGTTTPVAALHIVSTRAETSGTIVGAKTNLIISALSDSAAYNYGMQSSLAIQGASNYTTESRGITGGVTHQGTGIVTDAYGANILVNNASTGMITNAYGLNSAVVSTLSNGTIVNGYGVGGKVYRASGTGTITNAFGLYSSIPTVGYATNAYGVYIDSIQGTNNWGLYQADSANQNYFAGNVGIGTTTPGEVLSLKTASNNNPKINFGDNQAVIGLGGNYLNTGIANDGNMIFRNDNANSNFLFGFNGVEKFRIANTGNVGIGTTSPAGLLHLYGSQGQLVIQRPGQVGKSRISSDGNLQLNFTNNAYWNGSTWNRDDINTNASKLKLGEDGVLRYSTSASGANPITFTELFQVNEVGNVGIGTTTPMAKLSVYSTDSTTNLLQIATTTNPGIFNITSSGNVGIGTTNPNDKLDIGGSGNIRIGFDYAGTNSILKRFYTNHASGNVPSELDMGVYDGALTGMVIKDFRDGSFNSQSIEFLTHHGGVSAGTRMVIDKNGNVGIGTTTPGAPLVVQADGAYLVLNDVVTAGYQTITGQDSGTTRWAIGQGGFAGTNGMGFYYGPTNIEAMRINASGNLGIGTTNPGYKLEVNGTINASEIRVNGTVLNPGTGSNWTVTGSDIYRNGGNVGIGTTSPLYKLTINAGTVSNNNPGLYITSSGDEAALSLNNTATGGRHWQIMSDGANSGAGQGKLTFYDMTTGGNAGIKMVLNSNGNLGIGTTTPGGKLEIEGGTTHNLLVLNQTNPGSYNTDLLFQNGASTKWILSNRSASNDFWIYNTPLTSTALTISSSTNNVGIGTTTPQAKLSIYSTNSTDNLLQIATTTNPNIFNITSSGNVGIGTTTPTSRLLVAGGSLNVTGPANNGYGAFIDYYGGYSRFFNYNYANSTYGTTLINDTMYVTGNNGNVGIGTATPVSTLEVNGITTVDNYINRVTANGNSAWLQQDGTGRTHWYWNTYGGGSPTFTNAGEDANDLLMHVNNNGTGGYLSFREASGLGHNAGDLITWTYLMNLSSIGLRIGNDSSLGVLAANKLDVNGNAAFGSYAGTAAPTNGMIISGNVGIGTTSPDKLLHLVKSGNNQLLKLEATGSNDSISMGMKNATQAWAFYLASDFTGNADNALTIRNDTGSPSDKLVIQTDGNVGINTTNPGTKLQVLGAISAGSSAQKWGTGASSISGNFNQGSDQGIGLVLEGTNYTGSMLQFQQDSVDTWSVGMVPTSTRFSIFNQRGIGGSSGSEYLSITNTGNVGIGTTSPGGLLAISGNSTIFSKYDYAPDSTNYNLTLTQGVESADVYWNFTQKNISSYPVLTFRKGNVGIGTTSPSSLLNLYKNTGLGTEDSLLTLDSGNANPGNGSSIDFKNTGAGYMAAIAGLDDGSADGRLEFRVSGNSAINSTKLTSSNTAMTIKSNGNVGIGTTAPAAKLHISDTINPARTVLGVSTGSGGYTALETALSAVSGGYASLQAVQSAGTSYGNLILNPNTGNIGIGTTTPTRKLFVNGDAGGTGAWNNDSYSGYKENFQDILVLGKIKDLNIKEWQYKAEHLAADTSRHISPFSEDFRAKFGLGQSDYTIQALDVAGVALKGVQELTQIFNISNASTTVPSISIDAYGRIAIGTTTPTAKLEVKADQGTIFQLDGPDGAIVSVTIATSSPADDGTTTVSIITLGDQNTKVTILGDLEVSGETQLATLSAGTTTISNLNTGTINSNGTTTLETLNSGKLNTQTLNAGTTTLTNLNTGSITTQNANIGISRYQKNPSEPYPCTEDHDAEIAATSRYTTCMCNAVTSTPIWVQTSDGQTPCTWQ